MGDMMARTDLEEALGVDGMVPPSVILQGFRSLAPMGR